MFFLYVALVIASILLLTRASKLGHASNSRLFQAGDRVLIITAHPDDETMFFSPTILSLAYHKIPAFLLCLSNGAKSPPVPPLTSRQRPPPLLRRDPRPRCLDR